MISEKKNLVTDGRRDRRTSVQKPKRHSVKSTNNLVLKNMKLNKTKLFLLKTSILTSKFKLKLLKVGPSPSKKIALFASMKALLKR